VFFYGKQASFLTGKLVLPPRLKESTVFEITYNFQALTLLKQIELKYHLSANFYTVVNGRDVLLCVSTLNL